MTTSEPATLLRGARRRAGLTQQQLALRLGVSQAAVAKLERVGANPRLRTLADALRATGHQLDLQAIPRTGGVDESLIRQHLALSPSERLRGLEAMHSLVRAIEQTHSQSRGETSSP